uniref:Cnox3-Pc n=1 Tax=Podocoryna carnea TaxID=6096 RepID=Q86SD7_PODCA|nr:cnox3-Pc [Podocoryna carnea]
MNSVSESSSCISTGSFCRNRYQNNSLVHKSKLDQWCCSLHRLGYRKYYPSYPANPWQCMSPLCQSFHNVNSTLGCSRTGCSCQHFSIRRQPFIRRPYNYYQGLYGPRYHPIKRHAIGEEYEYYTSYELERNEYRRKRSCFDAKQVKAMEKEFSQKKYISYEERIKLSETLQLDESQIKIWFQNRRAKGKKNGYVEKEGSYSEIKEEKQIDVDS